MRHEKDLPTTKPNINEATKLMLYSLRLIMSISIPIHMFTHFYIYI